MENPSPAILTDARSIGAFIRQTRRDRGLDQAELAQRMSVSRQWLSEMENGKPSVELGLVLRAFHVLDLELSATRCPKDETNQLLRAIGIDFEDP